MKKQIPNLFTSLNLFSGCIASVMAFNGEYLWVVVWILIAAVFDFLDGFMARLLKAYSAIGKELDSLADIISFGFAPALMIFRFISDHSVGLTPIAVINPYIPYLAFLITVFSALRLAKFNVDERQTTSFIGFPTPPNALFWISYIYGIAVDGILGEISAPIIYVTLLLIFVFSFLLISEIPMFSLKTNKIALKGNELRYLLIVFIIIAVIFTGVFGLAVGMLFYIGISLFSSFRKQEK